MAKGTRARKLRAVSESLDAGLSHESDQQQEWSDIDEMHKLAGSHSPTGAMRDLYAAMSQDLGAYSRAFKLVPEQQGSPVLIDGEVAGFDVVSLPSVYAMLHTQIVQSYAIDSVLLRNRNVKQHAGLASGFLSVSMKCSEVRYDAVGQGYDYRFSSATAVGSALLCNGEVIHEAFFKSGETERPGQRRMPGPSQRGFFRRFRS